MLEGVDACHSSSGLTSVFVERLITFGMMASDTTISGLPELFDELPVGCHVLDNCGRIVRVNRKELELLGYSAQEMIGHFAWEFVASGEKLESEQAVQRKLNGTAPPGKDLCRSFVRKDGSIVPILVQDRILLKDKYISGILSTVEILGVGLDIEQLLRNPTAVFLPVALPIYIAQKDLNLNFIFANERFCKDLENRMRELGITTIVGRNDDDFHPPQLAKRYRDDDNTAIRTKKPLQRIERHKPIGSAERDVQVLKFPRFDSKGEVTGVLVVFWDVLEGQPVLAELESSIDLEREKYQRLFENAPFVGIFQSTPEGKCLAVNAALAKILGYGSAEDLKSVANIETEVYLNRADRDRFKLFMDRDGFVDRFEYEAKRKDGSRVWVSESARAVRNEQGEIDYYEGFIQDIDEKKRGRPALQRIERRLAIALQRKAGLDKPSMLQLQIRRVLCSLTASDGLKAHRALFFQLVGRELHGACAVGPRDRQEASSGDYKNFISRGNITFDIAMREMNVPNFVHPDRIHREVLSKRFPVDQLGGEVADMLRTGERKSVDLIESSVGDAKEFFEEHDIRHALVIPILADQQPLGLLILDCVYSGREHELPDTEEVIIFAELLVGLLSRAKYFQERQENLQLVALHGIGGRMNIIENAIKVLQRETLSYDGKDAVIYISKVLQQVRKTIRDLRGIARAMEYKTSDFDVNCLIKKVVSEREWERALQIQLVLDSSNPQVRFDQDSLKETLNELINNAHTWKRGDQAVVTVKSGRCPEEQSLPNYLAGFERNHIRLVISDQGQGISVSVRDKLFDPYASGSATGLGLGLARARKVLREQQGEIIETSRAGEGACFEIFLPIT